MAGHDPSVRAFEYQRASSLAAVADLLSHPGALPLGGGTDLLVCIEEGLANPAVLVDLRSAAGAGAIEHTADGGLRIGAAARLHDVGVDALTRSRFPALAQACASVGSPALRHMGTIGGNLCQRPRCWYYRRGISCFKSGGDTCPARDGESQHSAILEGGPCYAVHPSDPAVALTVLEARLEITGAGGSRVVGISDFFVLPKTRTDSETVLERGEFVSAIVLGAEAAGGLQFFRKLTQRGAWDFAMASVAGARRSDGSVRIVMGGVSPRPWRVPESVEEDVASGGLDEDSAAAIAERAFHDAVPLRGNKYKVLQAASLLRDAARELAA
jgi:xanthine dehydrogenase YagS FAD-binding subunit